MADETTCGCDVLEADRRRLQCVIAELDLRIGERRAAGAQHVGWSIDVGAMQDSALDAVLRALRRKGCSGSWRRECPSIVHFTLYW